MTTAEIMRLAQHAASFDDDDLAIDLEITVPSFSKAIAHVREIKAMVDDPAEFWWGDAYADGGFAMFTVAWVHTTQSGRVVFPKVTFHQPYDPFRLFF